MTTAQSDCGVVNERHVSLQTDTLKADEIPADIRAFFGHPLTAATTAIDGEDAHASALALLHEYHNLPAIDRGDLKVGDKYESIQDLLDKSERQDKAAGTEKDSFSAPSSDSSDSISSSEGQPKSEDPWLSQELENILNDRANTTQERPSPKPSSSQRRHYPQRQNGCIDKNDHLDDSENCLKDNFNFSDGKECKSSQPEGDSVCTVNSAILNVVIKQEGTKHCSLQNNSANNNNMDIHINNTGNVNDLLKMKLNGGTNGHCYDDLRLNGVVHDDSVDTDAKPSENTKRLMQALTEKILRKKIEHNIPLGHTVVEQQRNGVVSARTETGEHGHDFVLVRSDSFLEDLHGDYDLQNESQMTDISYNGLHSNGLDYHPGPVVTQSQWHHPTPAISHDFNGHAVASTTYANPSNSHHQPYQNADFLNIVYQNGFSASSQAEFPQHQSRPSPPTSLSQALQNGPQTMNGFGHDVVSNAAFPVDYSTFPVRSSLGTENYNLKSPDSGYNENCNSPTDATSPPVFGETGPSFYPAVTTNSSNHSPSKERGVKRRRSSVSSNSSKHCNQTPSKFIYPPSSTIPKLENDITGYRYSLEAPISTSQRIDEDRMTYMNKGQFYTITLDNVLGDRIMKCHTVKSVIMLVFRDDKTIDDEMKAWEFWHSRQHSIKQRILDIDTKNSTGIISNCVDEIAHNAVVVRWNPKEQPAKVSVAVNCLSTDFSNQKGVKGFPLHLQIDTFEDSTDSYPIHRGYCQLKVFCDKGAERKTRDEERRKDSKARKRQEDIYHPPCERSEFYAMADLQKQPLLFSPVAECNNFSGKVSLTAIDFIGYSDINKSCEEMMPVDKKIKVERSVLEDQKVLLYVREEYEDVYTALLVLRPTLKSLTEAIEEKYNIPVQNIRNVFKKCKKGILVKMDDNIVRHYSHQATFIIKIMKTADDPEPCYDVILRELED
ncbi:grainyhead-like protein 1 homolog isoform X2 [Lingula anatina]|uniref:Grainyhead-like protein 1 homolog isoform X2 n=1 Tax=Lingula anatina TaxID=7574 RepID=A0A1S3K4D5_LINAN|nr:grainyhead-like protein 1 homolog isoform X2 [Lingula anatina]|eukprot:XP_013417111.1 grainyhead-like protein 1 homolog isoform X2 [Lingula anatina]